jgi:hypothetical protein
VGDVQQTVVQPGLQRLTETLSAYKSQLGDSARPQAMRTVASLLKLVPADEAVVCFCQAKLREPRKANVVLVMTTIRWSPSRMILTPFGS